MNLREHLERLRLSQKMVAEGIGASQLSVSLWCTGKAMPSAQKLSDLLAFLHRFDPEITVHDLIPPRAA